MTNKEEVPMVPTTNAQIVCQNTELLRIIFEFQIGVPVALRDRLLQVYQLIRMPWSSQIYRLPPTFRHLKSAPNRYLDFGNKDKGIHLDHFRLDQRFPLHIAIAEGEFEIVQLLCKHKSNLFTKDALFCAIGHEQEEIAVWLCQVLPHIDPRITQCFEFKLYFDFEADYYDCDRLQNFVWYLCADALGFQLPFKNGNALLRSEIEEFLQGDLMCRLAREALQAGDLEQFQAAITHPKIKNIKEIQIEATKIGKIEFIKAAMEISPDVSALCCELSVHAARARKAHVLEWLYLHFGNQRLLENGDLVQTIIQERDINNYRWLEMHNKDIRPSYYFVPGKIMVEKLEVVRYLDEGGKSLKDIIPVSVEVANYLLERQVELQKTHLNWLICSIPNRNEHPDEIFQCLRKICEFYCSVSPSSMHFDESEINLAVKYGAVEFIRVLYEHKIEDLNESHLKVAIESGHLEIVKFMHEVIGWSLPDEALEWTITRREYDGRCRRYIETEKNYHGDPLLIYLVSSNKDKVWKIKNEPGQCTFETIQWLVENCTGSNEWELFDACVRFGSIDVLNYLIQHTSTPIHVVEKALKNAMVWQSRNILEFLWSYTETCWIKNGKNIATEWNRLRRSTSFCWYEYDMNY